MCSMINIHWCSCLFVCLFTKVCLFHILCFHGILVSSLWRNPNEFWICYLPKLAPAVLIASILFVTKRKYWSIYFSVILDFWCLANLVYSRSNNAVMDNFTLSMANNMNGFWDSVLFYIYPCDMMFFGVSLIYGLLFLLFNNRHTSWKLACTGIIVGYLFSLGGQFLVTQRKENKGWYPLYFEPFSRKTRANEDLTGWIKQTSILHSPICIIIDYWESKSARNVEMSPEDKERCDSIIAIKNGKPNPKYKVVLLLVESFEDWAINAEIMPNLTTFMETHNCFYAHKITKQIKAGTSMDGQMIINTGLLPIDKGATCFLFADNEYPSFAELTRSITVLSIGMDAWNQRRMSPAMHFDSTIVAGAENELAKATVECMHEGYTYVQTITMASHAPFSYGEEYSKLQMPKSMPKYMAGYLKSLNCTDAEFKDVFEAFDHDTCFANTIFVITGDHTIFTEKDRKEFSIFCEENNIDYRVNDGFCPLVIFSPSFTESVQVVDTCYQMDIYPTIINLLGCDEYYWKGFGGESDGFRRARQPSHSGTRSI